MCCYCYALDAGIVQIFYIQFVAECIAKCFRLCCHASLSYRCTVFYKDLFFRLHFVIFCNEFNAVGRH